MLDYVTKLKGAVPYQWWRPAVDDHWDRLNRGVTFLLLCTFGAVVTVAQYAGNVIACTGFSKFSVKFVEDYCWTQGLYTVREAYDQPPGRVPYPGLIPEGIPPCLEVPLANGGRVECPPPGAVRPPTRVYHLWYQWVPFYFWLAAAAFYLPYVLYKNLGMGEVKAVITLLNSPVPILTEEEMEKETGKAVTWLYHKFSAYYHHLHQDPAGRRGRSSCCPTVQRLTLLLTRHRLALTILLTKSLYLAVTVATFTLTSAMFTLGHFSSYGADWARSLLRADQSDGPHTTSVRNRIFPKMVSCEIFRWGASGLEEERGMCVLAPNVVNQYLFLITWFLLVTLATTNSLSLLLSTSRLLLLTGAGYRRLLLQAFMPDHEQVRRLYFTCGSSGRALLHLLAVSVRPGTFEDCVTQLAQRLKVNLHLAAAVTGRGSMTGVAAGGGARAGGMLLPYANGNCLVATER